MLLYVFLRNRSVRRKHVLRFDINKVQETITQLVNSTVLGCWGKWKILIGIEYHHIVETKIIFLVTTNQLVEHWREGISRT